MLMVCRDTQFILSHHQQGSNVMKEMVSNRIIAYIYVIQIHGISNNRYISHSNIVL